MASSIIGQSGLAFGTVTETGFIVKSATLRVTCQTKEALDKGGTCKAVAVYGIKGEHNFSAEILASGTSVNGNIGAAMTIFGVASGFGLSSGGAGLVDSIDLNEKNEDLNELSGAGTIYPSITA